MLPWQQKYLAICLLFRHLHYWSNVIGKFRYHILQNKEIMGLYAQEYAIT